MEIQGEVAKTQAAYIEKRAISLCAAMAVKARRLGCRAAVIGGTAAGSIAGLGADRLLGAAVFQKPGDREAHAFAIVVRKAEGESGPWRVLARFLSLGRRTVTPNGTLVDPAESAAWETDEVEIALDDGSPAMAFIQ